MLLTLYNLTNGSGNMPPLLAVPAGAATTYVLPGGAGVQNFGLNNGPFVPTPRIESVYREVLDISSVGGVPVPAPSGGLLVCDFTFNVSSGFPGAPLWSMPTTAQGTYLDGQFGIVFKAGSPAAIDDLPLNSGVGAEICISGPVQALCVTPSGGGAIAAGTLLVSDGNGNLQPVQPPSGAPTPTVTPTGGSATAYSYALVAISSNGTYSTVGSNGSTTAGAATLSVSAYNTITWTPVNDATGGYLILRTASAGSPATVGVIGRVPAGVGVFVDNGIAIQTGTTATQPIATLASGPTPTVVQIAGATAGTTTYTYTVAAVAPNGVWGAAGSSGSVTTGFATLSTTNGNKITFSAIAGAARYVIQRTAPSGIAGFIGYATTGQATSGFIDYGQTATTYTQNLTPTPTPAAGVALARSLGTLVNATVTPTLVPVFVGCD